MYSSESHNWLSQYTVQESPAKITPNTTNFWSNHDTSSAMFGGHKFNLNNEVEEEEQNNDTPNGALEQHEDEFLKQPLFEKSLTPSDVGKLNRLVIPKQHAEKYFPINGGDSSDQKGLLLNFEDEVGKFWKFRYSYWNSSQSYVLTKGWSRFVKEKRLDAGDVVLFFRHRVDATRLFIGWRRRGEGGGAGGVWNRGFCSLSGQNQRGSSLPYQADSLHAGSSSVQNQTATTVSGNFKRLRLFGVNLECQADESEPSTPDGSPMSGQGQAHPNPYHQFYANHQNHMDMIINFSGGGDVYRQG